MTAAGKSALILSGSIGRGHDSVAEACAQALESTELSEGIKTVDCMKLLGRTQGSIGELVFRSMIRHPAVYDGFHFTHLRAEGALGRRGNGAAAKRIVRSLDRLHLTEDLLLGLAVFPTGVSATGLLKARNPGMKSVVFCTDATVHSRWVDASVDLYVTTCDLAERSVRRYDVRAEVAVVPPAVRAEFFSAPCKEEARRRFEVPDSDSCVLLVSGGWGIGPVAEAAAALSADGHCVLAVSGSNENLRHRLDRLAAKDERVRSLGMCKEMPAAVAAADVVVSATGQTCNEVHAVSRPLVVLDAVPGHGRENLIHEVMANGAVSASPRAESVVSAVAMALKSNDPGPPWPVRSSEQWSALFLRVLRPLSIV
jgi:UDP-N-acetylglucosamine:LPS N-acetylglucosamine transferase